MPPRQREPPTEPTEPPAPAPGIGPAEAPAQPVAGDIPVLSPTDIMATFAAAAAVAQRTNQSIIDLQQTVRETTAAVAALTAQTASPGTGSSTGTTTLALADPKEHRGQYVHDFDFNYTEPGTAQFSEPAEPSKEPDISVAIRNETYALDQFKTTKFNPLTAGRVYWDKFFLDQLQSPYKTAFIRPTFDDLMRGTDMFYHGCQVFFSRFQTHPSYKAWLDGEANYVLWDYITKKSVPVTKEAVTAFDDYKADLKTRLDAGTQLELPSSSFKELANVIRTHNAKSQSMRKYPILPEYRDWGVKRQHGARAASLGDSVVASDGEYRGRIERQHGNYLQCNPQYDPSTVLSRGMFNLTTMVAAHLYLFFTSKGNSSATGRFDELICYDEMKSLDGNACPNHLYELMLIITKYYPESQTELVYQTQKAIAGFNFDPHVTKFEVYVSQYRLANNNLERYGSKADMFSDNSMLDTMRLMLRIKDEEGYKHADDDYAKDMHDLANSSQYPERVPDTHPFKGAFDNIESFATVVQKISDQHSEDSRSTLVPVGLELPTPREPVSKPSAHFGMVDDGKVAAQSADEVKALRDEVHALRFANSGIMRNRSAAPAAQVVARNDMARNRFETSARARQPSRQSGFYEPKPAGGKVVKFASALQRVQKRANSTPPKRDIRLHRGRPPDRGHSRRPDDRGSRRPDGQADRKPIYKKNGKEYIPPQAYSTIKLIRDLAEKSLASPDTSRSNNQQIKDACSNVLTSMNELDNDDDADDGYDTAGYDTAVEDTIEDIIEDTANEAGFDDDDKAVFATLYEQLSAVTKADDMSPADLSVFVTEMMSEHSNFLHSESHHVLYEDLDILSAGSTFTAEKPSRFPSSLNISISRSIEHTSDVNIGSRSTSVLRSSITSALKEAGDTPGYSLHVLGYF